MRKRILDLLRNSGGEPVSGEEISRQLEVSRTAIWKHIQTLKNEGYDIELLIAGNGDVKNLGINIENKQMLIQKMVFLL